MKKETSRTSDNGVRGRVLFLNEESLAGEKVDNVSAEDFRNGGQGESFNPNAAELVTSWSSNATRILCINSYPNGITVSVHAGQKGVSDSVSGNRDVKGQDVMFAEGVAGRDDLDNSDAQGNTAQQFHLRLKETRDYQLPEGKYYLYRENYAQALEQHLSQLHREGHLSSTVVYFGTTADPFLSLHKKFDVTLSCLDLLEQYRPGFVVIQTRSPMVITALPMLKSLQDRSVVVVPIESHLESSIARYTPGQPRVAERLVAVDGLRKQGVKVDLSVSPVLPYGDFYRDAWDFAELLARRADYVTFGCLASPDAGSELQLKNKPIAQKLIADNNYKWLRPYSFRYVYYAMRVIAPEKLLLPARLVGGSNQLKLFAA